MNECRECRAGRLQAVTCGIAWRCPDHGIQQLDIGGLLDELAAARKVVEVAREEWATSVDLLNAIANYDEARKKR